MLVAKIALLAGAIVGAIAAYVLVGRTTTPLRTIGAAVLVTILVGLLTNLAAHAGLVASPVARPLIAGYGAVFAAMIALSRVVLAPLSEKRYLAGVLYGALAFLMCGSAAFVAVKLLP